MPSNPQNLQTKRALVTVTLDLTNDPPFTLTSDDLPVEPHNRVVFGGGKRDGFMVDFVLSNAGAYAYFEDKDEALYSSSQAICPCPKGQWDQFKAVLVDNKGSTGPKLTVHNKNKNKQDFGYMLRITDGTNPLDLDPVGINHNSNSSFSLVTATVVFGVGAVAGAAAANFVGPIEAVVSWPAAAVAGGVIFLGAYVLLNSRSR